MRTIIAGSRGIHNYGLIDEAIRKSGFNVTCVISGGAQGIDTLAIRWAKSHGLKCIVMPADWDQYGRSAGYRRNEDMVSKGYAKALIAVWDGTSRGTKHMIEHARKCNLRVFVFRVEPERKEPAMSSPILSWEVVCDGGSKGNGSAESVGYGSYQVAVAGKSRIERREFGLGVTNNEAEYKALLAALYDIKYNTQRQKLDPKSVRVTVKTDSKLVVGQLCQGWKVKAPNLQPLVEEARKYMGFFGDVVFTSVPRAEIVKVLGH